MKQGVRWHCPEGQFDAEGMQLVRFAERTTNRPKETIVM